MGKNCTKAYFEELEKDIKKYDKLEKCLSALKEHLTEYIDKHNEDSSTVEENKRLSVLKDSVEKLDTLISDISKIVDTQILSENNATSNRD